MPVVPHAVQWTEFTKMEMREKVTRCFAEARRMVGEWMLPVWRAGGRLWCCSARWRRCRSKGRVTHDGGCLCCGGVVQIEGHMLEAKF